MHGRQQSFNNFQGGTQPGVMQQQGQGQAQPAQQQQQQGMMGQHFNQGRPFFFILVQKLFLDSYLNLWISLGLIYFHFIRNWRKFPHSTTGPNSTSPASGSRWCGTSPSSVYANYHCRNARRWRATQSSFPCRPGSFHARQSKPATTSSSSTPTDGGYAANAARYGTATTTNSTTTLSPAILRTTCIDGIFLIHPFFSVHA